MPLSACALAAGALLAGLLVLLAWAASRPPKRERLLGFPFGAGGGGLRVRFDPAISAGGELDFCEIAPASCPGIFPGWPRRPGRLWPGWPRRPGQLWPG